MRRLRLWAAKRGCTGWLGWRPRLSCEEAVEWSARWYADHDATGDPLFLCHAQIEAYEAYT